jgi:hypothetical protein
MDSRTATKASAKRGLTSAGCPVRVGTGYQPERPYRLMLMIILIVLVLMFLLGGFGYSRRGRRGV